MYLNYTSYIPDNKLVVQQGYNRGKHASDKRIKRDAGIGIIKDGYNKLKAETTERLLHRSFLLFEGDTQHA